MDEQNRIIEFIEQLELFQSKLVIINKDKAQADEIANDPKYFNLIDKEAFYLYQNCLLITLKFISNIYKIFENANIKNLDSEIEEINNKREQINQTEEEINQKKKEIEKTQTTIKEITKRSLELEEIKKEIEQLKELKIKIQDSVNEFKGEILPIISLKKVKRKEIYDSMAAATNGNERGLVKSKWARKYNRPTIDAIEREFGSFEVKGSTPNSSKKSSKPVPTQSGKTSNKKTNFQFEILDDEEETKE